MRLPAMTAPATMPRQGRQRAAGVAVRGQDRRAQPGVPEAAGRREIITEATSTAPPALNCAALGILRRDDALMSFRLIVNDAFMEQMRQPQPSTPVAERIMHYIH
jgi:hypothetical protein